MKILFRHLVNAFTAPFAVSPTTPSWTGIMLYRLALSATESATRAGLVEHFLVYPSLGGIDDKVVVVVVDVHPDRRDLRQSVLHSIARYAKFLSLKSLATCSDCIELLLI
jgi:hypothetical protein